MKFYEGLPRKFQVRLAPEGRSQNGKFNDRGDSDSSNLSHQDSGYDSCHDNFVVIRKHSCATKLRYISLDGIIVSKIHCSQP